MTGIAGMFGNKVRCDQVSDMLRMLSHRGPHRGHIMEGQNYVLGCCESNLGPTRTDSYPGGDKLGTVFDAHIYNERTSYMTDAELILDLRNRYGTQCFSYLDGTYAMAIASDDEIILARDHVGARPLFYGGKDGATYFASELKALRSYTSEVRELSPGTVFRSKSGVEEFRPFEPKMARFRTVEKGAKAVKKSLWEATMRRMTDGAVGGVALSGGLDSAIIAAIALQIDPTLHLFTIGLEGSPDLHYAQLVAKHLEAERRHEIHLVTENQIEEMVRDAVWHLESFEEDCVSGCIANMFASQLAAQYTNCCLCGEGADELFGGYHLLKSLKHGRRQGVMDILMQTAYNTGLRRLDRGWLANSVVYRTPFLDSRIIAFSRRIPVGWKIHGAEQVEKWILREAFRDVLPKEITDRRKLRFAAGTSVDDVMDRIAAKHVTDAEYKPGKKTQTGYVLNSPKELWYYRIFKEMFPDEAYELQVCRWDPLK